MDPVTESVYQLFTKWYSDDYDRIIQLQQSGSDRIYFRIYAGGESYTMIPCLNVHPLWVNTISKWIKQYAEGNTEMILA